MSTIEKLISVTFFTIGLALVLTNPNGVKQAGSSAGGVYKDVVGSFFRPK